MNCILDTKLAKGKRKVPEAHEEATDRADGGLETGFDGGIRRQEGEKCLEI